jgi:hypothetical protein
VPPTTTLRPDATGADPVQRLGRGSLIWRSALLVAGTVLITLGTLVGSDHDWPFGPMSQYAFRAGPDDAIHSTFLQARTVQGDVIMVSLTPGNVGMRRAEVEGQHGAMQLHPALLGELATSYHRLHPDRPALEQLWLIDRVTTLHRGQVTGHSQRTIVAWPGR